MVDTQFVVMVETDMGLSYDAQTTSDLSAGWTIDPAFSNRSGTGALLEYSAPLDSSALFIRFISR